MGAWDKEADKSSFLKKLIFCLRSQSYIIKGIEEVRTTEDYANDK